MLGKLEKIVFNTVKNNVKLKNLIVYFYQRAFCFFGLIKGRIKVDEDYKVLSNGHFGFHDRASMNVDGVVIQHEKLTADGSKAALKVVSSDTKKVLYERVISCFNNQQASLATFINKNEIIFNDMKNSGEPVTLIVNYKTGVTSQSFPWHFFISSPDSKSIVSLNFMRFGKGLEGYGYSVDFPNEYEEDSKISSPKRGISDLVLYNISGAIIRVWSIEDLLELSTGLIENGYFYFSHISFSPDSNKLYFLLRSSNDKYNSSQLFVFDREKSILKALPTGGMVSHLCWLSNDSILAYCSVNDINEDGYFIFDTNNSTFIRLDNKLLNKDGHPCHYTGDWFITDTYPDRERRQYLYLVNYVSNEVKTLCSIYSPLKFRGDERVDFHPRLSKCKNYVTFDSSHSGFRQQVILSLKGVKVD